MTVSPVGLCLVIQATLLQGGLTCMDYLCNDPISQKATSEGLGLGPQQSFLFWKEVGVVLTIKASFTASPTWLLWAVELMC